MTRNTRIVVGAVLVGIGVLLLVSYLAESGSQTRTETFSGVTELEFDVENSPVEVETTGGDEVVVDLSVSSGLFGGDARLAQDDGTLRLEHDCAGFFNFGCRASFEISVPPGVSVTGATSNGAVSLASLDAPIDVATSNGAVDLDGVSSGVKVRTSNGTITGTGLSADDFVGSTSNGRVELAFVEAPRSIDVSSSNGSIVIVLPDDAPAYAVDASTSNGEMRADIRTDPGAAERIEADTSNGDISIRYGS